MTYQNKIGFYMDREPAVGDVIRINDVKGLQLVVHTATESLGIYSTRLIKTFDTIAYHGLEKKLGKAVKKFQIYGHDYVVEGRTIKNYASEIILKSIVKVVCTVMYSVS